MVGVLSYVLRWRASQLTAFRPGSRPLFLFFAVPGVLPPCRFAFP
ncbi:hypothetical protein [Streptomyces sp. NPDC088923]